MRQLKISSVITDRSETARYFADVKKHDLLTVEEEVELAERVRQGDASALNRLVEANLRFVISVAKQYAHTDMPLSDLIQEGNIGLITAAHRFDPSRGLRFCSYAVWWIRQSILRALDARQTMIHIPQNRQNDLRRVREAALEYYKEFGMDPDASWLAENLGMGEKHVHSLLQETSACCQSLDTPIGNDAEGYSLNDRIADPTASSVEERLCGESLRDDLLSVLSSVLSSRECDILRRSFGIGCEVEDSASIAYSYQMGCERVRQLRERSIRKVMESPARGRLVSYL